ncbi:LOW QUALITY PROTEIN: coiled-coil domain-containing protein 88B [Chelonoidis abingdonii]|uniref:LOW QUALITY PROTEIN: coiled-coil domain-containing protein 88B n=1 Tax=Chelonoidis abingdonii TaxID=106734 RepID=UPI003F49AB82
MGVSVLPPTAGLLWVLVSWRPCRASPPPPSTPDPVIAEVPLCAAQKTRVGGAWLGGGSGRTWMPGPPLWDLHQPQRSNQRMDRDERVLESLGDFVSGPLVTWVRTLENLVPLGWVPDEPQSPSAPDRQARAREYFLHLADGAFLTQVMRLIPTPSPWRARPPQSQQGDERLRLHTLHTLLQQLRTFYQDDLQQLILMTPPNVQLLARDPLTEQSIEEMRKLLLLLLGAAVQCERKAEIIERIQGLDIETQTALAGTIQEVTQGPGVVLSLQWGALAELHPLELTRVLQELSSQLQGLVQERDASAERLWELQQEREVSSPHGQLSPEGPWDNRQHLGVQLADARGQARRLRQELEEKSEELLDQHQELQELEAELRRLRQEHRAVAGEARLAGLYRDELDAMREKAARAERLQGELSALRERLPALERCRGRLEEERAFSQALLDSKAQLEGQLESARARAQHLPRLEKENLLLRSQLEQVEEERERERQQLEELQQEKVLLEEELKQNLGESQHLFWEEEQEPNEAPSDPAEIPKSLSYEVTEVTSSCLLALERENQELRRRLQEALEALGEPRSPGLEQKNKALSKEVQRLGAELEAQRARSSQEREELSAALLGEKEQLERELRSLQEQRHCEGSLQSQGDLGAWAQEQQEALAESGRRLCQVEERASSLQEALRRLEATHAKALEGLTASQEARGRLEQELLRLRQELEQQRLEALLLGQLEAEVQALEKEREALQAELSQAEQELAEARGSLEAERQRAGRQAEQAREATEELRASERELGTLQRGLEQHKAALTQLEGERGALEAVLSQAERERRVLDKEIRRLRAQTQAQEEALAEQGRRAAQLEAQSRLQALELGGLRETAQRLQELEQESKGLREQLAAERKASATLREELLSEKVKGQEREADLLRLREQLERREEEQRLLEEQQGTHQRMQRCWQRRKTALMGRLGQLESQLGTLQGELLSLQGQSGGLREESGRLQAQCGALQVEQAALLSQKAALEARASELRERVAGLEAEVRVARQERDEWRGRHEGLVRNHDKLALLHERQGAELEGLLGKQAGLKGALRALEQEHRALQDRHSHLVAQQAGLEQREAALRGERERLEEAEREHRQLGEQHARLQDEHARVQTALAAAERAQEEQQGELRGLRGRLTGLQLEQARLEAEGTALREQNHQLEVALGRIGDQCELLAQLKGNQEEENRHLLQEIQKLSQENRSLLERSMESREQYHSEQRQHLDKLNELRREKQKLVEKIMDQYRVLEPALPKSKKSSNWIADKMKKLMKPRREPPREQQRPLAEGANSIENLPVLGQDGRAPDGDSSAPASPVPLRKATSVLSLPDAQRVHLRLNRRKLSSRVLVSESFGPGDATPRQRFRQRQRPLAFLGSSREEAAAPWEAQEGQRLPSAGSEERGLPQGKEKAPLMPQLSQ